MITLNLYFVYNQIINNAGKDFITACKRYKIPAKVKKKGSGRRHCVGEYQYRWIETSKPNFETYKEQLQDYKVIIVYFYNEDDMMKFIDEFHHITDWSTYYTVRLENYYGMSEIYQIRFQR